jgi:hypothetical protein
MSINRHIINHEIKLMKMGGREEIPLKRGTTISIILERSPASIATSYGKALMLSPPSLA